MTSSDVLKIYEQIDHKKERIAEIDKQLKIKVGVSASIDRYILNSEKRHLQKNIVDLLNKIQNMVMHQG